MNARQTPFDFLGFRFRYDKSIISEGTRYWNIIPKPSSCKKTRQKINEKLKQIGHFDAKSVVRELNPIIRGWMNYYEIEKVSYTQRAFKSLDYYLGNRLYRYYNRKSQRKSRLHGQQAYKMLVEEYGLIKPYKTSGIRPVKVKR